MIAGATAALGAPEIDTWQVLPASGLDVVSMDPVDPVAYQHSELLPDLSSATIDALVELGTDSPLIMVELRQLGGALGGVRTALHPLAHTTTGSA